MRKKNSNKELDLIDLGLRDVYSACYFFACSALCLIYGLTLSCVSIRYEALAPYLALLIIGLCLVLASLILFLFGFLFLKKRKKPLENPALRCPVQERKILRNGYVVSAVLNVIGIIVLTVGLFFLPSLPINGATLLLASFVVLFYGFLLLISTIRDHLIAKKARS